MPTTVPSISNAASAADRRVRPAPASPQTRSAGNRAALWIVLAIVAVTIVAGALLPAAVDSAAPDASWLVGP
jgi:hypothetical protein